MVNDIEELKRDALSALKSLVLHARYPTIRRTVRHVDLDQDEEIRDLGRQLESLILRHFAPKVSSSDDETKSPV